MSPPRFNRWWFSLLVGLVYLAAFQFWQEAGRRATVSSGLLAVAVLSGLGLRAAREHYFRNGWDGLLHAAVIADIFLEAVFVPGHEQRGFYLCALGFAAVIVGYRLWLGRAANAAPADGTISC